MNGYREIRSCPALVPHVETYWIWEGDGDGGSHRVLPDGCADVIFSVHDGLRTNTSRLVAVGTMTRPIEVSRRGTSFLLGVRFRPGEAAAFLGCPASEITDLSPPLTELWKDGATALEDRLLEAGGRRERLRILEASLLRLLERSASRRDLRVAAAVGGILRAPAAVQVPRLAGDVGLSPRQLRRRFIDSVGIGPKRLARIVRLRRVLDRILTPDDVDWADLAVEAGFYDQAHLVNDFRAWTGLAPSRYLAERSGG